MVNYSSISYFIPLICDGVYLGTSVCTPYHYDINISLEFYHFTYNTAIQTPSLHPYTTIPIFHFATTSGIRLILLVDMRKSACSDTATENMAKYKASAG